VFTAGTVPLIDRDDHCREVVTFDKEQDVAVHLREDATMSDVEPAAAPRHVRLAQLGDTDLRLLKVFKAVADCGGLTAAALELDIGVSTVSRHVKDLETRLGLSLCKRGRSGFGLTLEGQQAYEQTSKLLGAVNAFRNGIEDIHGQMGGRIEVALFDKTASNPAARIGRAIDAFVQRAPGVTLHVQVATIGAIERGLLDGSLDIGVIPAGRESAGLICEALFDETMLLYSGARHALSSPASRELDWESLRAHPFAGLGDHSPNRELSLRAGLRHAATGLDQEAIATLILSGRFLGFLPDHYGAGFVRSGQMQVLNPRLLHYRCRFVCARRRAPTTNRATLAMRECLLAAHRRPRPG
jgi:DNA-binding transcriptional LysR family regulator